MALPWIQIVQLVPSILDVSRELMKRTKQAPPAAEQLAGVARAITDLHKRVLWLTAAAAIAVVMAATALVLSL